MLSVHPLRVAAAGRPIQQGDAGLRVSNNPIHFNASSSRAQCFPNFRALAGFRDQADRVLLWWPILAPSRPVSNEPPRDKLRERATHHLKDCPVSDKISSKSRSPQAQLATEGAVGHLALVLATGQIFALGLPIRKNPPVACQP